MSYSVIKFDFPTGNSSRGTFVADRVNQFLAINPTLTPVELTITWEEGRSRSDCFNLNLVFRPQTPNGRFWAVEFQSRSTLSAEAQASAFFAANPTFTAVMTTVLTRPTAVTTSRRLLIVYAVTGMTQTGAVVQHSVASINVVVAVGDYAPSYDTLDATRPIISTLNMGNVAWPAGATNMLIRTVDNVPDQDSHAAIAPCCYAGAVFVPPAPLAVTLLCDSCISQDLITVLTTVTTTTSTTTTPTTTTTTTTPTTTTTTTSSTTTTGPACAPWTINGAASSDFDVTPGRPPSPCAGSVTVDFYSDVNAGTAVGAVVTVTVNGVPSVSGCMTSGSFGPIAVPAGATLSIAGVFGCNGGAEPTTVSYAGSG